MMCPRKANGRSVDATISLVRTSTSAAAPLALIGRVLVCSYYDPTIVTPYVTGVQFDVEVESQHDVHKLGAPVASLVIWPLAVVDVLSASSS